MKRVKWKNKVCRVAVSAEVYGVFAIHHSVGSALSYTLSHVPSGYAIAKATTVDELRAFGEKIAKLSGWRRITYDKYGDPETLPQKFRIQMRELIHAAKLLPVN